MRLMHGVWLGVACKMWLRTLLKQIGELFNGRRRAAKHQITRLVLYISPIKSLARTIHE